MGVNVKPIYGFMQPANGLEPSVGCKPMPKGPKTKKAPSFSRDIVSNNIATLMAAKLHGETDKPLALAKLSGLTKSTIQRIVAADVAATIDSLAAIAGAFECSIADLVTPSDELMRTLGVTRKAAAQAYRIQESAAPYSAGTGRVKRG